MATDIGPRIGLDGEKEFRQSLKAIDQQLKSMGAELRSVSSAFDDNAKSEEALTAQNQVLGRSIDAAEQKAKLLTSQLDRQKNKLNDLGAELDRVTQEFGANSKEASAAQNAYNRQYIEVGKLETQLNNTTDSLNKMRSQVASNERTMKGLDDALDEAGDSADSASDKFSALTVAAGDLISSGIQAAADAVMNLVSSLWNLDETTEEYRRGQGRLNTAFEAAGYGAETAQESYRAFYGILGDVDTATEASQLLAKLAESEEDVAKWTEIAAGVSGTFGDSLPIEGLIEAANETAKVGEVTGTLADALNWAGINEEDFNARLAECSTESERNQLIMETLAGQYDEAADAFYRNNEALVAARNATADMDEVTGKLGQTISSLKTELTAQFFPALAGLGDAFNGILTGAPGATAAFTEAIQSLITTAVAMLPQFLDTGLQILNSIIMGIVQSLPALAAAAVEIVSQITSNIGANLSQVVDIGLQLLDQLTDGIISGIPAMVERIPEIITQFLDFLTGELPKILDKGVEILNELVNGIIGAIPDLLAALPEVISAFLGFVVQNLPQIIQAGNDILFNLIDGILAAIPDLVASLPEIVNAIVNGIVSLMANIVNVGKDIVRGIWDGISDMAGWIKSKVTGFFSGIVDSVKGLLGIHSPSTVFAGMGENMALGLEEGFAGEMRGVQRQINRSMEGLVAPSMTYGVTAAAVSGAQGGSPGAEAIAAAVRTALEGSAVYLNGQRVGNLVTRQQNNAAIARGQSQVYI